MPKVLTQAQVDAFERDGCLSPVRAMSAERAQHYRRKFDALDARVPDIKKMKTKSHLLCPWVLEIAEDPHILDTFEDLIGPNFRCWSMAWRVKKADGETFAGWHQDSAYGAATPVVLGGLALSDCGVTQGCLRGVPGSHKWGILKHEESRELLRRLEDFLGFVLPAYQREGKAYLTVALGCTGGRHRSVALVDELKGFLDRLGLAASVAHRDMDRE